MRLHPCLPAVVIFTANILAALQPAPAADVKPPTVKAAAIQFTSQFGKPAENRQGLEPLIREAAKNGAKIVVLPETAITGYLPTDLSCTWQVGNLELSPKLKGVSPADAAETVPGESTLAFGALAKELQIYLTIPLLEVDRKSGEYFNTVTLAGPDGQQLLHYRKQNPWPWAERGWATKGDRGHQYVDTPFGRMALLICFDINFEPPTLKRKKVDHLLYPIAWVDDENSTWFSKQLPTIAKENRLNIIGANWSPPVPPVEAPQAANANGKNAKDAKDAKDAGKPTWHGYGQSLIITSDGQVRAKVKSDFGNEIIYAQLPVP